MLTNEKLLRRLSKLCRAARQIDVGIVLLLIEVEDRRLHLEAACSSLHDFCRRHLRWSEGTTHRRIEAARITRRCPSIVGYLRSGAITLSALAMVRAHIDESNVKEWVPRLAGKSRREIEVLLADLAPKPDVPSQVYQLPPSPGTPAPPPVRPARLQPLGAARWKIQLMAGQALHDKVGRAVQLMRHRNPSGDLSVIFEAAIDALLARLEKPRRLRVPAKARAPRATREGDVSATTRAEVFVRDEERCTFVSADGERCPATDQLEIDHIVPRARGGTGELSNLRVRCRPHNQLQAEKDFGRAHIERRINERKAARRTSTVETYARASDAGERSENGANDNGGSAEPSRTTAHGPRRAVKRDGVARAAPTRSVKRG